MKNQHGIRGARRLLGCQLLMTLVIAGLFMGFLDTRAFVSAVLGGLVCVIPNAYFAKQLFRYHGALAAKRIVSGFYRGEALKIALSAALFALVFRFFNINPVVFFATYLAVQMVFWFTPLLFETKKQIGK